MRDSTVLDSVFIHPLIQHKKGLNCCYKFSNVACAATKFQDFVEDKKGDLRRVWTNFSAVVDARRMVRFLEITICSGILGSPGPFHVRDILRSSIEGDSASATSIQYDGTAAVVGSCT